MKIILSMRVWAHLSRWRMELIKLSLHLPQRGNLDKTREMIPRADRTREEDRLSERPRGTLSSTLSASHSSHWLLHRNLLSDRSCIVLTHTCESTRAS